MTKYYCPNDYTELEYLRDIDSFYCETCGQFFDKVKVEIKEESNK